MNQIKQMKKVMGMMGLSATMVLSALNATGGDSLKEEKLAALVRDDPPGISREIPKEEQESGFQWILHDDGKNKVLGESPDYRTAPQSLESMVSVDKNPHEIDLNEWEFPAFSRLVPLKRIIEREANRYMINPMWAVMFYNFESQLNPTDHNKLSNDFGLGQIKRESESLAKKMGTDPDNPFFSPHLDKDKSIFDPETNIIMSQLLHRYNIEKYGLTNSDQTYAIYVRGEPGLNHDGRLSRLTKDILEGFRDRYNVYEKIIPLFRTPKEEVSSIKNPDTRFLIDLYNQEISVKDMYASQLDYFLNRLETSIAPDARSVLLLDDCSIFAQTLEISFGTDQTEKYDRIEKLSKKLMKTIQGDLKERVEKTYERFIDRIDR